jgi:hypothetical protein
MRVFVEGVGLLGPGLSGWARSLPILCGTEIYVPQPTVLTVSALLPSAERRRTGAPVKLALAVAEEAFANAQREPASTATVFTSSSADGDNVHAMLEVLASSEREVSPTRFHNSVHNAAAGYWSLGTQSRTPSTSLCAHDASFAAGLLEAAAQLSVDGGAAAVIAYDHPYPEPLASKRPVSGSLGVALVLTAAKTPRAFAALEVNFAAGSDKASVMEEPGLETLRAGIPAARSLPLLQALARAATAGIVLEHGPRARLTLEVAPCR